MNENLRPRPIKPSFFYKMNFRHSSFFSYGSHKTLQEEEPHYNEMSDEELKCLLEDVIDTNKILIIENEIFERYLKRQNAQCLQTMAQILESAKQTQRTTSQLVPISSAISFSGSTSMNREKLESPSLKSSQSGSRRLTMSMMHASKGYRINLTHRMEMAQKEIEDMKKNLKKFEQTCVKKRENLTARLEEAELRIVETADAKKEFQEKVVDKYVNTLSRKIPAEKFIRFIEERLKITDNMIDKLRLKTSNLKTQIKKMREQFKLRREISEAFRPIELEHLTIENENHELEMEERRKHFLEMKKVFGHFNLMVTNQKQNLSNKQIILQTIKDQVENENSKIEKLKKEKKIRETQILKMEEQYEKFLKLKDEYLISDILNFAV